MGQMPLPLKKVASLPFHFPQQTCLIALGPEKGGIGFSEGEKLEILGGEQGNVEGIGAKQRGGQILSFRIRNERTK